ncbi:MAG TPA: TonB-dependent receptor [Rubrivivax sp.]|nr:TonB-dependent receptor [Rubrivivax sp.]
MFSSPPYPLRPLAAVCLFLLAGQALAQAQTQTQTIVITGNPLGRSGGTQPVSVLSGDALLQRRAATLGETLDGLPGVAASGFGPNSSRPVIRGLDGERVRLLDNSGVSVDASALSFDHAPASDPLIAERIEVLRGPATLLYGGNAIGGVINSLDNRIPRRPATGLSGRAELRAGGAMALRSGAAVLEGGAGPLAWHVDAFGRSQDDLRVPEFTPIEDGAPGEPTRRVRNSASRSAGGAVGGGWAGPQGYLGAAVDTMNQRYGITVEPGVVIRMQRDRLSLAGEWRLPAGSGISKLTGQASRTRYQHDEVEAGGEVGTRFGSRGSEARLQAQHAPLGPLQGVIGVQLEDLRFSALGEEAFVPDTETRSRALFVLEEVDTGGLVYSGGVRVEDVRVSSRGDADPAEARFGAAQQRRFSPSSAMLGLRTKKAEGAQFNASLGRSQRAPAYHELYANGVHLATAAYERGDPTLPQESGRHAELGAGWVSGTTALKLSLFETRFSKFLALQASGQDITVPGEAGEPDLQVPEYLYRAVRARLRGAELEGRTAWRQGGMAIELSGSVDTVRGQDLDRGEALPRLAPERARLALQAEAGQRRAGIALRHAAAQRRVPSTDTATAGWTQVDLWLGGDLPVASGTGQGQWLLRLANVGDKLAFNAASVATVRGLAPMPGRSLSLSVRGSF